VSNLLHIFSKSYANDRVEDGLWIGMSRTDWSLRIVKERLGLSLRCPCAMSSSIDLRLWVGRSGALGRSFPTCGIGIVYELLSNVYRILYFAFQKYHGLMLMNTGSNKADFGHLYTICRTRDNMKSQKTCFVAIIPYLGQRAVLPLSLYIPLESSNQTDA
jgi:hypothetical protein